MHLPTAEELNTFNPVVPEIIGSLCGWLQSSPNNCQADNFGGYTATDKFEEVADIVACVPD